MSDHETVGEIEALQQTSGDLCPECNWRGMRGDSCAFCDRVKLRAEVERLKLESKAWELTARTNSKIYVSTRDARRIERAARHRDAENVSYQICYTSIFGAFDWVVKHNLQCETLVEFERRHNLPDIDEAPDA